MSKFLIVDVLLDLDYCEGVRYIETCDSEEEATEYIKNRKQEIQDTYIKLFEYIDEFVEAVEIPNFPVHPDTPQRWKEFKEQLAAHHIRISIWATPETAKENIKAALRSRFSVTTLPGFNPPPVLPREDLHILEVPTESITP